jgi:tetratricopeptide (TPR) repeat protein
MSATLDAARWRRLQDVLDRALDAAPEQRARLVAEICGDDVSLRDEALELLQHVDSLPEQVSIAQVVAARLDADGFDADAWIGREIGAFVLEECIGRGGSSVVYRARRRNDFSQQVAIKLLHGVGTPARRFLRERDFLAALNHPNIARLFDAGTTPEGVPYLVLEYVQGRRWDRELELADPPLAVRLERFARVCDAVAHAHAHLLVHRDIKPANLLVDKHGEPHLLDFGIARLLDASADEGFTRDLGPALTPAYAAPEQIRGEPPTTATDVYALGVLLYETLTGANPFRDAGNDVAGTLRAVAELEPPRPSALRRGLHADLDAIVLTAMAKEPKRRYASARQLADDVRAWLAGRPVAARAPTLRYLAGKFAARHRIGVALGGLALAALFVAVGVALYQARETQRERAIAEQRLVDVRRFVSNVLFDYHEGIQELAGSLPMQRRMVEDSLRYLETLKRDAGDDASLWSDLAAGYLKIGDVQGNPYGANLGDFAGADESYIQGLDAVARLRAIQGDSDDARFTEARLLTNQAHLLHQSSKLEDAAAKYREGIAVFEAIRREGDLDVVIEHARALDYYGDLLGRVGVASLLDTDGALQAHARARELREQALASHPGEARLRYELYHSQLRHGEDLVAAGRLEEAEKALLQALDTMNALFREKPEDGYRRRETAMVHTRLAAVRADLGQADAAIEHAVRAFRITDDMAREDPDNDAVLQGMTASAGWAARFLVRAGRTAEAAPIIQRQIEGNEDRLSRSPGNPDVTFALSLGYRRLGELRAAERDYAGAVEAHGKALELQRPLAALSPEYALGVPLSLAHIGRAQLALGRFEDARKSLSEAVQLIDDIVAANPEAANFREDQADMLDALGQAWLPDDCNRALATWDRAVAIWAEREKASPLLPPQIARRDAVAQRGAALRCARP